jgi:prepilin-type N-terminal cleavage/methylation domain-containing protein
MNSRERGFTVIELMTVVAIIGILAAFMIGMSARPYGVNAANMAEQVAQSLNFARTRALSTRKIHRVSIRLDLDPVEIDVYQAELAGMKRTNFDPLSAATKLVERTVIPNNVTIFTAVIGANVAGAITPAQTTAAFEIDFLPNGAADVAGNTGGTDAATIYITDSSRTRDHRVLVYSATGSSYARTSW